MTAVLVKGKNIGTYMTTTVRLIAQPLGLEPGQEPGCKRFDFQVTQRNYVGNKQAHLDFQKKTKNKAKH